MSRNRIIIIARISFLSFAGIGKPLSFKKKLTEYTLLLNPPFNSRYPLNNPNPLFYEGCLARGVPYMVYAAVLHCLQQHVTNAQLHAGFLSNPASGCTPVFVHFTDVSTGNPASWKWDLGNGTVSFLQNPSTTYFAPGKYKIKLVITMAILLILPLAMLLSMPCQGRCSCFRHHRLFPLKVNFTDQSLAQEGTSPSGNGTLAMEHFITNKIRYMPILHPAITM